MTTYTTISNAAVAVGGIPSSSTVQALRDNPIAIAEQASGAPVLTSAWHPYDKVTIGDGKTGLIYDFAVNGLASEVVTPDFADGWEYKIVGRELSHNSGSGKSLNLAVYSTDKAAYDVMFTTAVNYANSSILSFDAELWAPRVSESVKFGAMWNDFGDTVNMKLNNLYVASFKVDRAKVYFTSASFDRGKIYLLRRHCYRSA